MTELRPSSPESHAWPKRRLAGAAIALAFGVGMLASYAEAASRVVSLPVPKVTLKRGDVINLTVLEQKSFQANRIDRFNIVPKSGELLGKEVTRELIAGMPIHRAAVAHREIIKRGAPAQLIFREQGLNIIAYVEPLEDGVIGDVIRVRNLDSGLIVSGVVQPDGTISIGP
ncbi:flagella basal body P-ring formation protein FlgA [Cohaesibacter sp. ES.047]|uniref:flagellar basal body P-ring formation chaperone FlgA n=1 Tax=Cohaesibacter sp. ES.047 TaxID=1798205 RepID=UPI000BB929EC|nr:flagellar basal body P-ring formation chaperone FlgA [Cohaesibacter sp. ES.047]SNY92183.1 flagella basal body P-ring formation protein FlgA [Cohaesibacter sp. ES.047]